MLIACKSRKQNKSLEKEKMSGVATELIPERRLQNSADSVHCRHLYIWFGVIRRDCVCENILFLSATLWVWQQNYGYGNFEKKEQTKFNSYPTNTMKIGVLFSAKVAT